LGLSTVESLALFFELVKHIDGYYYGAHFALYIQVRDRFSKLIAVRYIGGIRELPTFWAENNYKYHGAVVKKLCERVYRLIQDVDIDSLDGTDKYPPTPRALIRLPTQF